MSTEIVSRAPSREFDADVVVIGAGAAGLAAARLLAGRSFRTIVLEGRDRAGGRAWSSLSVPGPAAAEYGAEFIHGPAAETMRLLREAGSAAVDSCGEGWAWDERGGLQRDDDFVAAAHIFEGTRTLAADESVEQFLQRFANDGAMRATVGTARRFVEGFDAADPAIASARGIAAEWRSGVDDSAARPIGGYRPMFAFLRERCLAAGVGEHLSTVVRRIAWRPGAVSVDAQTVSGESLTLRARAAIVTLPIGVLRHRGDESEVIFDPELPEPKRAALEKIEMGHVVKVVLRFRTAFWERIGDGRYKDGAFFRGAGQSFGAYWTQYPVRSELVVAWAGGPKAVVLGRLSHEDIVERALAGFGALFDEAALARAEFEEGLMHDWDRDPFARGAYSYVAVGGENARLAFAQPLGDTLFFAGEATSNDGQGGTVNGALETGERAAREVASALAAAAR